MANNIMTIKQVKSKATTYHTCCDHDLMIKFPRTCLPTVIALGSQTDQPRGLGSGYLVTKR